MAALFILPRFLGGRNFSLAALFTSAAAEYAKAIRMLPFKDLGSVTLYLKSARYKVSGRHVFPLNNLFMRKIPPKMGVRTRTKISGFQNSFDGSYYSVLIIITIIISLVVAKS